MNKILIALVLIIMIIVISIVVISNNANKKNYLSYLCITKGIPDHKAHREDALPTFVGFIIDKKNNSVETIYVNDYGQINKQTSILNNDPTVLSWAFINSLDDTRWGYVDRKTLEFKIAAAILYKGSFGSIDSDNICNIKPRKELLREITKTSNLRTKNYNEKIKF